MMRDNRGQVSLEYLLIFAISMILLIAFTLPLTDFTIQTTLDVIQTVYGQGQGSRQIVNIISQAPSKIDVTDSHVSCNLKLKDGSRKLVKVTSKSNLAKTTIPISEGTNTIVVEWPVGSETMNIHKTG